MFSSKDLHLFAEAIPHIMWSSLPDGSIDYCNRYGLKFIGVTKKGLKGNNWLQYTHPDDRDTVIENWDYSIKNKSAFHQKQRILNGKTRQYECFQVDARPVKGENQEIEKWIGISINIQKEVDETKELANNKVKFEEILNHLPDTNVYVFDAEYRYIEVRGPKFEEGPFPADVIGKTVNEAYGEEWAAFSIPLYQKVLEGGTFYEEISTAAKQYFVQGAPLKIHEDPAPKGILVVREITDQKNTLDSLRKSEENIRFLYESSLVLANLNSTAEIYEYVAEQLHEITSKNTSVVLSKVSQDETEWRLLAYKAPETFVGNIAKLLKKKLPKLKGKLSNAQKKILTQKILVDIGADFNKITNEALGNTISEKLQSILAVKHCYVIGFLHESKIFGVTTLLAHKELPQHQVKLIEAFISQASITVEKIANKEKLQESENLYKSLVLTMREGVMSLDAEGIIITANKAVEEILGFTAEGLLGKNLLKLDIEIIVDEQTFRSPKTHPIAQVLQKKKSQRGIIIGIRKLADRVTWISMNAEPLFKDSTNKEIESVVVSFTDITKLKRSEDRLALYLRQQTILTKIAQKLNLSYQLEDVLVEIFALIGHYTELNRICIFENIQGDNTCKISYKWQAENMPLKENEEAILDYDFIKPWKETLLENRIMAIKSVETIEGEMEGVYRSRSTQAVAVLPLYISDDFFGFISFEDCYEQRTWRKSELDFLTLISEMLSNAFERRKLQLELVQSEERLLQANQLAKLGHWEWNVEDDKVIWSKEIFDFFKYDSENSPPSFAKQKDLYKKDSYNLLQKRVENAIKVGGPYELELQANPEKFGVKYFHIMGIPEMKDGTLVRLFGSMQDITERKLSALQIEDQNYSLRKLNNELDLIMKILSHDLKSPINQAKGLVRLLEIDPTNKEIMGHMNKSIKRLQEITDDLLNLAINDRIKVEPEEIFWDNFVNLCIEEHEGSDGFDQIDWQINIQGKNEFITDSKRLKIVIRNLLSNAVKYRNTDNEKPSFIKVEVDCKEHEVTLEVSDNGLGIAKEKLELIFEMFYQVDKTTKGVGLGLHIVKQMLEKINGKVEVSSVEKEGTTFKVLLPMLT